MREDLKKKIQNFGALKIGIILITYIFILIHLEDIFGIFSKLGILLAPFFYGLIIAYLIDSLVKGIQQGIKKILKKEISYRKSMIISYVLLVIVIVIVFSIIIPQVIDSINVILNQIPSAIEKGYTWLETEGKELISNFTGNDFNISDLLNGITNNVDNFLENVIDGTSKLAVATFNAAKFLFNLILSFLISIYMLMHKDLYIAQIKKMIIAFCPEKQVKIVFGFLSRANHTFSQYLNARIIDSVIIGLLCYICCMLLGFKNSMLIAIIIGITNVIPFFGPFLGAVPCALITLLQGPMWMFGFIVFILILQQFDGNILGPKLLGDSLGLTSLLIIFSIIITTGIFGIMGTLIGVPLFTIFYMVLKDYINLRLMKKNKSVDVNDYMKEFSDLDIKETLIDLEKEDKK